MKISAQARKEHQERERFLDNYLKNNPAPKFDEKDCWAGMEFKSLHPLDQKQWMDEHVNSVGCKKTKTKKKPKTKEEKKWHPIQMKLVE